MANIPNESPKITFCRILRCQGISKIDIPDGALYRFNEAVAIPGDFNYDGICDAFDLNFILANWYVPLDDPPDGWLAPWDGMADAFELNYVLANWYVSYEAEMPLAEAPLVQEMQCEAVEECLPADPVQTTMTADPVLPVFVSHRLVAVRFRTGRLAYRNLLVVGQRCAAEDFRRLRVRLIQSAHGNRDRAKIPGA